jgi:hypothetical protein
VRARHCLLAALPRAIMPPLIAMTVLASAPAAA